MIFRRRNKDDDAELSAESTAPGTEDTEATDATDATDADAADGQDAGAADDRATSRAAGPFDSGEVALEPDQGGRLDLGSLLVGGESGMELRLQVDEESQEVQAALIVIDESALELRAFAAPRTAGIWDEVRAEITEEAKRMGGTAEPVDGPFGPELLTTVTVQDPEGNNLEQTTRILGVDGPRWLLRGTILGRAAVDASVAAPIENCFRDVIVVRGEEAMAPREPLPLKLPDVEPDNVTSADGTPAEGADETQPGPLDPGEDPSAR